jgi:hypothetical protein
VNKRYQSVFVICAAKRNDPGHEDWQIPIGLPNTPGWRSFSSWTAALTKPPGRLTPYSCGGRSCFEELGSSSPMLST